MHSLCDLHSVSASTDNMGLGEEDGRLLLLPAGAAHVLLIRIAFQGDSEPS